MDVDTLAACLRTSGGIESIVKALLPHLRGLAAAELLPGFPMVRVDPVTAGQIRQGRDFHSSPFQVPRNSQHVKAIDEYGTLVAIGELLAPNLYHPSVVMAA